MTTKATLPHPQLTTHFLAAALAGIITTGTFTGVTALLQRDGKPFEQLVAAERACADHAYVSEREACVREWLAHRRHLAGQTSDGPGE